MYNSTEMMEIFAVCAALAGIAYFRQLFTPMRYAAVTKPALEYSINGDLVLPVSFHEWVHLRLTDRQVRNLVDLCIVTNYPDAYVEPMAYENFLSTNVLPEGIIAFKRIVESSQIMSSVLAHRRYRLCCDSSEIGSADVAVRDSLQSDNNFGWRFFRLDC